MKENDERAVGAGINDRRGKEQNLPVGVKTYGSASQLDEQVQEADIRTDVSAYDFDSQTEVQVRDDVTQADVGSESLPAASSADTGKDEQSATDSGKGTLSTACNVQEAPSAIDSVQKAQSAVEIGSEALSEADSSITSTTAADGVTADNRTANPDQTRAENSTGDSESIKNSTDDGETVENSSGDGESVSSRQSSDIRSQDRANHSCIPEIDLDKIDFTNDLMFSIVMQDIEIYTQFLQRLLPDRKIGTLIDVREDDTITASPGAELRAGAGGRDDNARADVDAYDLSSQDDVQIRDDSVRADMKAPNYYVTSADIGSRDVSAQVSTRAGDTGAPRDISARRLKIARAAGNFRLEIQKTLLAPLGRHSTKFDSLFDDVIASYNIELQNEFLPGLPQRSRLYGSHMDVRLLKSGERYDEMRQSFVIFICRFDPFGLGKWRYDFESRCDEDRELTLRDGSHKIFFNTKGKGDDISPELKNLLTYINDPRSFPVAECKDPLIQKIDRAVEVAKMSFSWQDMGYISLMLKQQDAEIKGEMRGRSEGREEGLAEGLAEGRRTGLAEGHRTGLAEGRRTGLAEGRAEGRRTGLAEGARNTSLETARRMLQKSMSVDDIADVTGLAKSEIVALQS